MSPRGYQALGVKASLWGNERQDISGRGNWVEGLGWTATIYIIKVTVCVCGNWVEGKWEKATNEERKNVGEVDSD